MPRVDFADIQDTQDYSPLPEGRYLCRVIQVEEASTRNGDEMWKLRLEVTTGEYTGRLIFDNLAFSERALPRLKLVCERLGLDVSGELDVSPAMLEGKTCVVETLVKSYLDSEGNEKQINQVPFSGYYGMDDSDVSDDDDGPRSKDLVVVVDTREQKPYAFAKVEVRALATGDYSIVGLEDRISIERKTKADAYGSIGRGRARFQRELERLSRLDYGALVIEASLPDFLRVPGFSTMNPRSALASVLAWSVRYGVFVFFAGDRRHGNALTRHLLEKFWRYHGGEHG